MAIKRIFGFSGALPEKVFVCKHNEARVHGLFKDEFGYAAEVMMPALARSGQSFPP